MGRHADVISPSVHRHTSTATQARTSVADWREPLRHRLESNQAARRMQDRIARLEELLRKHNIQF